MKAEFPEPNLIILGAQKSGTTSLHEYLRAHPDIFMSSPVKEPGYYLDEKAAVKFWQTMGRPIHDRRDLLENRMLVGYEGQKWFGESSTYYTLGERSRKLGIPQNMQRTNPEMRFIYIVRNPYDRIRSNYLHAKKSRVFCGSFRDFLRSQEGTNAIKTSLYNFQLSAYTEHFPKSQFLLLVFEDLIQEPQKALSEIHSFLNIPDISPKDFKIFNASSQSESGIDIDMRFIPKDLRTRINNNILRIEKNWGIDLSHWSIVQCP